MIWFTIAGTLVVVASYFFITKGNRGSDISSSQSATRSDAISLEEARALVNELVLEGEKLFVEPSEKPMKLPENIGPITREFFLKYGTLKTRRGGFRLAAAELHASEYVRGFISIGHSEDWDVVQRPGSDEVFVVEGSERDETQLPAGFASVYHLVLDETGQV